MLRRHENKDSFKAGLLALAVHVGLLAAMLISFNWKAAHPVMNVTEVELWDKIPKSNPPEIKQIDKPVEPKPVEKIAETKPVVDEKPKVVEPKIEDPKVDIALAQKKKELALKKLELEKIEKDQLAEDKRNKQETKKLAEQMREEDLQEKVAEKQAKADKDKALKKLREDMLNENGEDDAKASSSANASLVGEYKAKIQAKIRGNVNKVLCGDGNPELKFSISLLPTGELAGTPKLTKSSGNAACDDAVERAIAASQPLPLPSDAALFSQFRNLDLKFKPNE